MAFQIKRGTNSQRLGYTAASGELIYATDTKILYVGDGTTPGGVTVGTVSSAGNFILNGLSGSVVLAAGSGMTLSISGNTLTFATTGAPSGLSQYVESINGFTGVVTGAAFTTVSQSFNQTQIFSQGISSFGGTFSKNILVSGLNIGKNFDDTTLVFGKDAGPTLAAQATYMIAMGEYALSSLNDSGCVSNTAIGSWAGRNLKNSSNGNLILGDFAGSTSQYMAGSVLLGSAIQFTAPSSITDSILIGGGIRGNVVAGFTSGICKESVIVGGNILQTCGGATSDNNTFVGYGILNTTQRVSGSRNLILGSRILNPMDSSDFTMSNCIMLGSIEPSVAFSLNKMVDFPFTEDYQLFIGGGITSWIYGNISGNILLGDPYTVGKPSEKLHVAGNIYSGGTYMYIANKFTPGSSADNGTTGAIAWDNDFIYVCIGTNSWRRAGLTSW